LDGEPKGFYKPAENLVAWQQEKLGAEDNQRLKDLLEKGESCLNKQIYETQPWNVRRLLFIQKNYCRPIKEPSEKRSNDLIQCSQRFTPAGVFHHP